MMAIKFEVYEVFRSDGSLAYRGCKETAEYEHKREPNSTMKKVARPSRRLQQAAFLVSSTSLVR